MAENPEQLRELVRECLGEMLGAEVDQVRTVHFWGGVSAKSVAEAILATGLETGLVLVDLRGCRTVGGRRPWWNPKKKAGVTRA